MDDKLNSYRQSHMQASVASQYESQFTGRVYSLIWDEFVKPWLFNRLKRSRDKGAQRYFQNPAPRIWSSGTGTALTSIGGTFVQKARLGAIWQRACDCCTALLSFGASFGRPSTLDAGVPPQEQLPLPPYSTQSRSAQ